MKKPIYKFDNYSIHHICDGRISYWEVHHRKPVDKTHHKYNGGDGRPVITFHSTLPQAMYKVILGVTDRSEQVSLKHYAERLERVRDEFFAMAKDFTSQS